jgi:zinc transporter ZupT
MLGFAESFLAWLGSTAAPAFLGLLVITSVGLYVKSKYLVAFALGIFLWFFVDTIEGSADLDVNAGFGGGLVQFATVLLFVAGVLTLFSLDRQMLTDGRQPGASTLAVPILVALAVGIHGFGEGTAFGNTASSTPSTALLDAFGGLSAGVAYALHKALEPMMIGACYLAYSGARGSSLSRRMKDIGILTLLFVTPSLIGAATGYYLNYDATYFFALGTGTSVFAALTLSRSLFSSGGVAEGSESLKTAVWLILGFLCIYIAALFHS